MKILYKILLCMLVLVHLKVLAQLDTLNYIKQFEMNKNLYLNQPFSKLLHEMNQLPPKILYTQRSGCNYATQFYFSGSIKSNYKITIIWDNISFYKNEVINRLNELYELNNDVSKEYQKYYIKSLKAENNGEFFVTHFRSKLIDEDTEPYIYILQNLNKTIFVNKSFSDFYCWLRPLKIIKSKNISTSKGYVSKTVFLIINPYDKRKKVKLLIEWDLSFLKKEIKKLGKSFNNKKRNVYISKIIKNIEVLNPEN
ncbi:hypothetical protein [Chryseobacterium geocarposphaerae]|nr:hypothetical protein [Chryseobacterium geocarposphaerae]